MRDLNDGFSGINGNCIILVETARFALPTEDTLNDLSPRQLFPPVGFGLLRNISADAQDFIHIQDKGSSVACVSTDFTCRCCFDTLRINKRVRWCGAPSRVLASCIPTASKTTILSLPFACLLGRSGMTAHALLFSLLPIISYFLICEYRF